jgi:hypothetical protein
MTNPHPPTIAVKPAQPSPKPDRRPAERNYERAPTARHALQPDDPPAQ